GDNGLAAVDGATQGSQTTMTQGKHTGRKTQRVVRTPATKSGHLRKRMQQQRNLGPKPGGR
ncbi:MAG: hypothetical protein WAU84_11370, partial [Thermoguttaceae bacterium]